MSNTRPWTRVLAAGAAVALAAVLSGCSLLSGMNSADVERDQDTGAAQEAGDVGIFNMRVGDCKMEDTPGSIEQTTIVPCDEPHDEEVYAEFALEDGDYPGDDAIEEISIDRCAAEFEKYVGAPYDPENGQYEFFYFQPSPESWDQLNDRIVQCVAYDAYLEQITGSIKGIGQS